MSGSDTEDSDFASIFGGDVAQASRIPEDLRPILLERWNRIRHELDASRPSVAPDDSGEKATSDPSTTFLITFANVRRIGTNSYFIFQLQECKNLSQKTKL